MQRYLETRTATTISSTAGADLARHLLARQHLGKTVIVCDKPQIFISVVRKYWLKLARTMQRERASTLNAEKILQLTYDITHMHHMDFVAKPFAESSHSDVFFVMPKELTHLPPHCFSLYIMAPPQKSVLHEALSQLPELALVVDYTHDRVVAAAPLVPKAELEQLLPEQWQKVEEFFHARHIDVKWLTQNIHRADRIDEAIDVILNTSNQFLRVADDFLSLLRLAQPLHVAMSEQQLYDMLTVLQRRIYALTPGTLSQQFAQSFGNDEPMLHDVATEHWSLALAV